MGVNVKQMFTSGEPCADGLPCVTAYGCEEYVIEIGQLWTVALRRQPVRIVGGEPEGGYTDAYELICCDCGDNPDLDYLDVAPDVQLVRGPYPLPAGVTAYARHVKRYHP